jgi:hypothetical protein
MRQDSDTQKVRLYPSPEFLDAGKFKHSKLIRQELSKFGNEYEKLFQHIKDEATSSDSLISVQQSSIAATCGTQSEVVHQILTNFFACLIEINRKTKKEVKVSFGKTFGSLCINVNG